MIDKRYKKTSAFFAKMAALNKVIDEGGEGAKDAQNLKSKISTEEAKKPTKESRKGACHDLLDSRARLPGSYESGKRR